MGRYSVAGHVCGGNVMARRAGIVLLPVGDLGVLTPNFGVHAPCRKRILDLLFLRGSQFAPAKYELAHFTKDPKANSTHALHLPYTTVSSSPPYRYLGIQMNIKL